jgi:hypothetical protein
MTREEATPPINRRTRADANTSRAFFRGVIIASIQGYAKALEPNQQMIRRI